MQLEKSNKEYKFNFFNKSVHRNFKKINIVCGLLIAVSAIFGVSQVSQLNRNIEPEGKMQFKVDEDKILYNLQDIDFNPDGEKMKNEKGNLEKICSSSTFSLFSVR